MKETTVYKLTDVMMRTYGGCQWRLGVKKTRSGDGELCGPGWLHAYTHPLLAEMLNPIHANLDADKRLFRARGVIGKRDGGLKVGCRSLTLVEEIPVPAVTHEQRVRFAILCAWEVYRAKAWRHWARGWLDGTDRSYQSAAVASQAARKAVRRVKTTWAADAATAADEASESAEDDWSVESAAFAVSYAVEATKKPLDLIALAEEAMTEARR